VVEAHHDLPDDETLRQLVMEQRAVLVARELAIETLKVQLARLRRMTFGRPSEQLDREIAQLELQLEELEETAALQPAPAAPPTPNRPAKAKPVRRPLPDHLPREDAVHEPACLCPRCSGALRKLGEDVTEELEYVPSHFKVIRHVRPKLSCRSCEAVVQAPMASRPIERGLAGPGLLAHVLVSKYADHLPLYRQSEIYAREGVDLDRSTLAGWVGATAAPLRRLSPRESRPLSQARGEDPARSIYGRRASAKARCGSGRKGG
jgi:transposase